MGTHESSNSAILSALPEWRLESLTPFAGHEEDSFDDPGLSCRDRQRGGSTDRCVVDISLLGVYFRVRAA